MTSESVQAERLCRDCGCPADDHNNADCGLGCTRCGDCDGFNAEGPA